ncbi:T9SS type A sorting domain-containing protein [Pontibacter sp. MBLB2868]|uniref:T9SS type A sorting domain-containing protein n=1 Tax=Pontibacter sp. MBLB2868 TaxID=3451555 RepID=UPI003F752B4F
MRKITFVSVPYIVVVLLLLGLTLNSYAQTPGLIYKPATNGGNKVLDPDGNGYVSKTSAGFTGGNDEGAAYSEIDYKPFPVFMNEPLSDLSTGAKYGHTDYAPKGVGSSPLSSYFDGTNLLFRVRLAGQSTASKGYSILIDTNNDVSGTGKNPGFEYEVVLTTNFDVRIYNHGSNTTTEGPQIFNGSVDQYSQKSIAASTGGGDPDYFYDFYVPIAAFGSGLTASTPIRMTGVTVTSAKSGLFGVASDIGGVDDTKYSGNFIGALKDIIGSYTPTTPTGIQTGGFAQVKATAPVVNGPINKGSGTSQILTGYSVEAAGSVIDVFQNGILIGSTTVTTNGTWSLTVAESTLVADRLITATVKPANKSLSDLSSPVKIQKSSCFSTNPPTIYGPSSGNKGLTGTTSETGLIKVYLIGNTSPLFSGNITAGTTWVADWGNQGGSLPDGTYYATVTVNGCESNASNQFCFVSANNGNGQAVEYTTPSPTITPSSITASTATVTITGKAGSTLTLTKNGVQIASTTLATNTTTWVVNLTNLSNGDVLYARATYNSPCTSTSGRSNAVNVAIVTTPVQSAAPVIIGSYCGTTTAISGTSSEAPGTTINLYDGATLIGTTKVNAYGAWTISGLSLVGGKTVTAKATALNKTESVASSPKTIGTSYSGALPTITSSPIVEGDTKVTGKAPVNTVITLYINGDPIVDINGNSITVVTNSAGDWTFSSTSTPASLTPFDFYAGAKVTVSAKASGSTCESAPSAEVEVQCKPADQSITTSLSKVKYCPNEKAIVKLNKSEAGTIYNVYIKTSTQSDAQASLFSYSMLGTGGALNIETFALASADDGKKLFVQTFKVGASCKYKIGSDLTVGVYGPVPNNFTLLASNQTSNCPGTSSSITVKNALTGYSYQLIYYSNKNKIGSAIIPTIDGDISFPAMAVSQTTDFGVIITRLDGGCIAENENAQKITITRTGPLVNQTVTPSNSTICPGSSVTFSFSTESASYTYTLVDKSNPNVAITSVLGNSGTRTLSTGTLNTLGTKTYQIKVTTGTCTSTLLSEPTVTVTNGPSAAVSAGSNKTVCGPSTTLQGSDPAPGVGTWAQVSGPSASTIVNTNSVNPTVTGLVSGDYVFKWSITTSCGEGTYSASTVTITVNCPAYPSVKTTKFIDEYVLGDVLAVITDSDGGISNYLLTSGIVPPGTALSISGNQVYLKVTNASTLVAGNYTLAIRTTDAKGFNSNTSLLIRMYDRVSTPTAPTPLPVHLAYFTGSPEEGKVLLQWVTAMEKDNDRFEIERSTNGEQFEQIGIVKGNGNSSQAIRYNFTDKNPGTGTVYYRLRQVDYSGESSYSKIISVALGQLPVAGTAQAYPNPFTSELHAVVTLPGAQEVKLEVVDIRGQAVYSGRQAMLAGFNQVNLPLQALRTGLYFLKLSGPNINTTLKVLKAR